MTRTTYKLPDVPKSLVGTEWVIDGWRIKLTRGRKGPGDVRIWVATPGGEYSLMRLAALGAIVGLWYRNEDRLYPEPASGGRYVLSFLEACCQPGGIQSACRIFNLRDPKIAQVHGASHGAPTDEPPPPAPFDTDPPSRGQNAT